MVMNPSVPMTTLPLSGSSSSGHVTEKLFTHIIKHNSKPKLKVKKSLKFTLREC